MFHRLIPPNIAIAALAESMRRDDGYAWSWHCNLAMLAQDAGAPHGEANERAADFMQRAFGVDVRKFQEWRSLVKERDR